MRPLSWAFAAGLGWLGWAAPRAAGEEAAVPGVLHVAYALAFLALWAFHRRQGRALDNQ